MKRVCRSVLVAVDRISFEFQRIEGIVRANFIAISELRHLVVYPGHRAGTQTGRQLERHVTEIMATVDCHSEGQRCE
jgi:hypothetical protein